MSGIVKAVKKVFKKVAAIGKAIVKKAAKIVNKVFKSKIGRIILTAAAIWFTAGAAAAYFAAPQAGFLSAMQTSATNMWSTATSFLSGGSSAAAGSNTLAGTAGNGVQAMAGGQGAAAIGGNAATLGNVGTSSAALGSTAPAATTAATTVAPTVAPTASGGLISKAAGAVGNTWNKIGPMGQFALVQGVGNAAAGYSASKEAEKAREAEQRERDSWGLYGQDINGKGADLPTESGLLSEYLTQPPQPQPLGGGATQAPTVAANGQRVMTPQELAQAQRQGYIANPTRRV